MDPRQLDEISRLIEKENILLEKGIPFSEQRVKVLERLASTALEKLAKELGDKQFKILENSTRDFTRAMYEGQQGAAAMVSGLEAAAAFVKIMTSLVPQLRLLTIGLSALTAVVLPAVRKFSEQADELFKTYQDLNKNGLATAGGMSDVYKNMQQFNYGVKDLAQMTALLRENSESLANFGGTASSGVQAFANVANEIQRSSIGRSFQMMGKTPDEINRGIAGFIKSQQDLGVSKSRMLDRLAEHSAAYIKEIDVLNRLTGQSEEQTQEKIAQAMAEDAFNQIQYELQRRADAGDLQAQEQLKRNRDLAAILPGKIRDEFIRGIAGDVMSMTMTLQTAPLAARLMKMHNFTVAEYLDAINQGIQQTRDIRSNEIKLNLTKEFIFSGKDMSEMARYTSESAQSQIDRAKDEQELQKKNLDPTTKKMVELRIDQQKTRDAFQNFVNKGINPAVTVMESLESGLNTVLGIVPGTKSEVVSGERPTGDLGAKGGVARTTAELRKMGLNIRSGDVQADGRLLDDRLIKLAKLAQSQISGFQVITSLNDNFHAERYSTSQHALGRAMDFTLDHRPSEEEGQRIVQQLKSMGASYVIDEYNHPSKGATGGHIHAQVSAAMGFEGTISGPASGYRPNIVMHGEELLTITPRNKTTATARSPFNADTAMLMKARLEKINRVVELFQEKQQHKQTVPSQKLEQFSTMVKNIQNQIDVSRKILQAVR
jgi:hypothetical protein